ncbi:17816_t:CDS:2 [Dentiscutata erythropus]|uniref:17816_t:CDS:1 n=1 Tax=Dentiscutata erythropus TaxID=1348616 RepID=A0A9N9BKM1_9GLOM|nr:17816_t:CDS:2 [Dentiscutata erythropus]
MAVMDMNVTVDCALSCDTKKISIRNLVIFKNFSYYVNAFKIPQVSYYCQNRGLCKTRQKSNVHLMDNKKKNDDRTANRTVNTIKDVPIFYSLGISESFLKMSKFTKIFIGA